MQYTGKASLAMRHQNPLPQLLDRESGLSVEGIIPEWKIDPRVLGLKFKHSPAVNTPGNYFTLEKHRSSLLHFSI